MSNSTGTFVLLTIHGRSWWVPTNDLVVALIIVTSGIVVVSTSFVFACLSACFNYVYRSALFLNETLIFCFWFFLIFLIVGNLVERMKKKEGNWNEKQQYFQWQLAFGQVLDWCSGLQHLKHNLYSKHKRRKSSLSRLLEEVVPDKLWDLPLLKDESLAECVE